MSRVEPHPSGGANLPKGRIGLLLAALQDACREVLEARGCTDIREVRLRASPTSTRNAMHVVLNGRLPGGGLAIADPLKFPEVRLAIRRMSWLLGQKDPAAPELVVFVVPGDLPMDVEAGTVGLRTRVEVVRAEDVRLGWTPRRPQKPEYAAWVRVRPHDGGTA